MNISDALLDELRVRAHEAGRPMNATVEEVLRRGLAAKTPARKAITVKAFKVGIKPAYLGLSMNQLYDQIEAEETLKIADTK